MARLGVFVVLFPQEGFEGEKNEWEGLEQENRPSVTVKLSENVFGRSEKVGKYLCSSFFFR